MAQASKKITPFPAQPKRQEEHAEFPEDGRFGSSSAAIDRILGTGEAAPEGWRRRLENAERQRDAMQRQRDEAVQLYKDAKREAEDGQRARKQTEQTFGDWKKRLENAERQRDAMHRQRDEAVQLYKDAKREAEENQRMRQLATQTSTDEGKKVERELQKQIAAVCQARDAATAQIADLKQRIADLDDIVADLTYCKEVAEKNARQAEVDVRELRNELDAARVLSDEAIGLRNEISTLAEQLANRSATIEVLDADLAAARSNATASDESKEGVLGEIQAKLVAAEKRAREGDEAKLHFDEIRAQFLEVNYRLETAQREILGLTASIAETRLQAKASGKILTKS